MTGLIILVSMSAVPTVMAVRYILILSRCRGAEQRSPGLSPDQEKLSRLWLGPPGQGSSMPSQVPASGSVRLVHGPPPNTDEECW